MGFGPRSPYKLSPGPCVLARRVGGRLAGLGLVVAVSACAGPTKRSSPIMAAEQRASQEMVARCLKSSKWDEAAKSACLFLRDMFGTDGVRWAASHLNPDGSLRESRAVFDEVLRKRAGLEQRRCMNSWLARKQEKGPPNLDPALLAPNQAICFLAGKQFLEGASALADEAISKPQLERTIK